MVDAPILETGRLRAGWGQTEILDGIDLTLAAGETLAVLGRNGVGKTTLLSAIMGRARQHGGEIRFCGNDVARLSIINRSRSGMALVPQEREIFKSLTVQENLQISHRKGGWTLDQVYDLFPRLAERNRHMGSNLSGGEQQMLSIARGLMTGPKLLMLDEPMEGLAPVIIELIVAAIKRITRETGIAVLLVEQHARIALSIASRVIVLDRGRVVYESGDAQAADINVIEDLIALHGHG